jgi:hypothetical protein
MSILTFSGRHIEIPHTIYSKLDTLKVFSFFCIPKKVSKTHFSVLFCCYYKVYLVLDI